MKRVGNIDGRKLYDCICDEDNIRLAIREACKDHHRDRAVQAMKADPEPYVQGIRDILTSESFHYGRFKHRIIRERGKDRKLCYTRTYPDRVIQHAVFNIVGPILHREVGETSFAGVKGRGLHRGARQVATDLQCDPRGTRYCAKLDIYHFFDSVDRHILFDMLRSRLKCRRTLDLLHRIIFQCPGKRGLPIGLFSSQVLSVFFLSGLDHYVKETLHAPYYFRYMDDIALLSNSKAKLWAYIRYIRRFIHGIGLRMKGNYAVFPVEKRRLDFMGYVSDHRQTMIRKRTKISFIRACNRILRAVRRREPVRPKMFKSLISYEGMLSWCSDRKLADKYLGRVDRAMAIGVEAI